MGSTYCNALNSTRNRDVMLTTGSSNRIFPLGCVTVRDTPVLLHHLVKGTSSLATSATWAILCAAAEDEGIRLRRRARPGWRATRPWPRRRSSSLPCRCRRPRRRPTRRRSAGCPAASSTCASRRRARRTSSSRDSPLRAPPTRTCTRSRARRGAMRRAPCSRTDSSLYRPRRPH